MKTYRDIDDHSYSNDEYTYQKELTIKLDNSSAQPVTQELINEIVLWKLNRFALVEENTLTLLNKIDPAINVIDDKLVHELLQNLLSTKGIRLPMASTILRFRNPNVYQIIDQHAYRFVYGEPLALGDPHTDEIRSAQIKLYLEYLGKLRLVANETGWAFSDLDRILYIRDQQHNKDEHIKV